MIRRRPHEFGFATAAALVGAARGRQGLGRQTAAVVAPVVVGFVAVASRRLGILIIMIIIVVTVVPAQFARKAIQPGGEPIRCGHHSTRFGLRRHVLPGAAVCCIRTTTGLLLLVLWILLRLTDAIASHHGVVCRGRRHA